MGKSQQLTWAEVQSLFQLVNECRELGDDCSSWRDHWIRGLAKLVDADISAAGEMSGCKTNRPNFLGIDIWWQAGMPVDLLLNWHMEEFRNDPNFCPSMVEYHRQTVDHEGVCLGRSNVIDDRTWYSTSEYEIINRSYGIDHMLWCFRPLEGPGMAGVESGVIMSRALGKPMFSDWDRQLVQQANALLTPLIGGALARDTEPSPMGLTPGPRRVLACLLEGDSNKQIAKRLKIAQHTVNGYTKEIFSHFQVHSRAELLARWIRRGWSVGATWSAQSGDVEPVPPSRGHAKPKSAPRR